LKVYRNAQCWAAELDYPEVGVCGVAINAVAGFCRPAVRLAG
jgi:hypothetical protein